MFYQENNSQSSPLALEKQKASFLDRVNIIVDMILDNVQGNSISKSKLLSLVVSNVLKNE
jgi:hypothetical protein